MVTVPLLGHPGRIYWLGSVRPSIIKIIAINAFIPQASGSQQEVINNPITECVVTVIKNIFPTGNTFPAVTRARAGAITVREARRLIIIVVQGGTKRRVVIVVAL